MSSVYFIEGIPGSGKSTYAQRLYDHLLSQGNQVEMYSEGDLHPIDLAWCSIIKRNVFNQLVEKHSKYRDQILSHSKFIEDIAITAYTKIQVDDDDGSFYDDFSPYEIYRTKDFSHFKNTHLTLWQKFNMSHKKDTIYIFECIFLQNHINELILKFGIEGREMIQYFQDLLKELSQLSISIFYIKPLNVKETFDRVIDERRSSNPNFKDWIDQVLEYFQNTKYGKKKAYLEYDGALQYFKDRQKMELKIIKKLPVDATVFDLRNDYDLVFQQIIEHIANKNTSNK